MFQKSLSWGKSGVIVSRLKKIKDYLVNNCSWFGGTFRIWIGNHYYGVILNILRCDNGTKMCAHTCTHIHMHTQIWQNVNVVNLVKGHMGIHYTVLLNFLPHLKNLKIKSQSYIHPQPFH